MGEPSQGVVEIGEAGDHVLEAPVDELAMRFEDVRVELIPQPLRLALQRKNILDRAVVKVEAKPQQPFLARPRATLPGDVALEQVLPLEHRFERQGGLIEVGADIPMRVAEHANDDSADRRAEPPDRGARALDLPASDNPLLPVIAALATARI